MRHLSLAEKKIVPTLSTSSPKTLHTHLSKIGNFTKIIKEAGILCQAFPRDFSLGKGFIYQDDAV
jgi:uncharacterized protein (UPF0262 family)